MEYIYDGQEMLPIAEFNQKYNLPDTFVQEKIDSGFSESAIVYAAKHPERGVVMVDGMYLDSEGFMVLIPRIIKK